jgi:acyl carrier protein
MISYEDSGSRQLDNSQRRFRSLIEQCCPGLAPGEIDLKKSMRELGIDSIGELNLVVMIENEYDILLPTELLLPEVFATPISLWEGLQELIAADKC